MQPSNGAQSNKLHYSQKHTERQGERWRSNGQGPWLLPV